MKVLSLTQPYATLIALGAKTIETRGWGTSFRGPLAIHAARLIHEAKRREKWVHVGRVNTLRRQRLFSALDIDSFDGSCFSKFPDKYIPWMLKHTPYKQHGMMEVLL